MIELQKNIYELIYQNNGKFGDYFIEFNYSEKLIKDLNRFEINFESLNHNSIIRIDFENLPFHIFENPEKYLKLNIIEKANDNILIFSYSDNHPISYINGRTYRDFILIENFYFFSNALFYFKFIDFLKSLDNDSEGAFHFIDYFNKDNKKIVLTSLSEKSRIIIKYKNEIPLFDDKIDYSKDVKDFISLFNEKNNQIIKFLKNSFIEFSSRYNFDDRLPNIYTNLNKIIEMAQQNFEIYINNLSIDKLKEDYNKYKSKYFSDISDILSKLTQKIIGLPIAFATTLFVINKITNSKTDENSLFLYTLIAILLISSIFITLLLKIHFTDLLSLYSSFNREYNVLINNNFFKKYPDEIIDFEEMKNNIHNKITILEKVTIGYYWILSFSNLFLIYFILKKVNIHIFELNLWTKIISIIVVLLILVIGHKTIVSNKRKRNNKKFA